MHFVHKDSPQFWKAWNTRFKKNISKGVIINGHTNDDEIASEFASHFKSVFYNSDEDGESNLKYYAYRASIVDNECSTGECIDDIC